LANMNEYEIIEMLTQAAGKLPRSFSPIGDDVASMGTGTGRLVLKADMLVGRTDIPPGMSWRQAGRKSVAMCVSDFASKGVLPKAFMVSLGIPRRMHRREIRSLVRGFKDGIREWGPYLIGGDTNEADDLIIDCVLAGFANRYVERKGSRPGELVVVTGDFGTTSAGLRILLEKARCAPSFRSVAVRNVYLPSPRLALGVALRNLFSSAMDSSDGLAICLHSLSSASGVGMRIDILPHRKELAGFAAQNGYRLDDLVLYGGEEYEIVGTIPKDRIERARTVARSLKSELKVIGETTPYGRIETSTGDVIEKKGWIHLA
jgi:thiamine-monophosphate kinase